MRVFVEEAIGGGAWLTVQVHLFLVLSILVIVILLLIIIAFPSSGDRLVEHGT